MHGEVIPQEDNNHKFLRSLSQEWTMHTIVWRNKPEIETLSLDDLFNNLKAYESEVKGTSSSTTNSRNVAFLSFNSTNNATRAVNTTQANQSDQAKEGPTKFALMAYSSTSSTSSTNSEFNSYKDAKTLMQAIKNRFGGNAATKKTQKNLLKQQYENFAASSTKVIEQTYERFQKLISQLEMHGEVISQEYMNQKFLRSLSQE
ncbi:hypothetical protein Tco_0190276 [Tanacetum coccineum]